MKRFRIFPVLLLLAVSSMLGSIYAQESEAQNQGTEAANSSPADKADGKSVIIINNNYDNSDNSDNSTKIEAQQAGAAQTQKAKPTELGTLIALYSYFGYGSISGEATLGYNLLSPSTYKTEKTGYLNFFHASLGLSVAVGPTSLTGYGAYVGWRVLLVVDGSYPFAGVMFEPNLDDLTVMGVGADLGVYLRQGLWGKDMAGGLGGSVYWTFILLSGSPDVATPFAIMGPGLMLDVFFSRNIGISGRFEVLFSRYESLLYDEFKSIGPSFSFGIILGE